MEAPAAKKVKLKVLVTFPLGTGKPYKSTEEAETTVGEVRQAAMSHFGVSEDVGSRYYLAAGPHQHEVGDAETLGSIDEDEPGKGTIKFTLVKELIQG